jgi:hypothetical protein
MKNYLLCSLLLFSIPFFAQPTIEWQKTFGGSNDDLVRKIIQTNDGGYIIAGSSASNDGDISGNHGISDIIVIKISSIGDVEWQKCYGGSNKDNLMSIQKTTDGGYIIAGNTLSNDGDVNGNHGGSGSDCWIIKITNLGIIEWQKCLGGSNGDGASEIQQTLDGGYIVGCTTSSIDGNVTGNHNRGSGSGNSDYWVVKLTNSGNIVWQKCLGSYSSDGLNSIKQTSDGGYILNGQIQANDGDVTGHHGDFDYWVVKINSTGVIEWQKTLGGTGWDTGVDVIQNSEGDYIVTGYSSSNNGDISGNHGGGDAWIVKLSATGNMVWQKSLGGTGDDYLYHIQQTADGGYLFSGDSSSNDGQAPFNHGSSYSLDCWIVKTTSTGDFEWGKLLGGSGTDTAVSLIHTLDGGYAVSGYTNSVNGDITSNHGTREGWIVKLTNKSLGNSSYDFEKSISFYPNPAKNLINVDFGKDPINNSLYYIYDQQSRIVLKGELISNKSAISIENLVNGVYFLKINNSKTGIKFIKN